MEINGNGFLIQNLKKIIIRGAFKFSSAQKYKAVFLEGYP